MKNSEALSPEQIQACYNQLEQQLRALPWFNTGQWLTSSHVFPPPPAVADGMTFQLYKPHWFNEEHHGIHFETFLDFRPQKQKHTTVTLHLLHLPSVPGTTIKRREIALRVVDRIRPVVESWPDYQFRAGAYGQQPFARTLMGQGEQLQAELLTEFTRMATSIGPVIDEVLTELKLL